MKIDTHCDSILTVEKLNKPLKEICNKRQLDFPRLLSSGIDLQFFAIFIETRYKPHLSLQRAIELLDLLYEQVEKSDFNIVLNKNDLQNLKTNKEKGILISIEGGDCIESLAVLRMFYKIGVRSVCLTWNNRNHLADGVGELNANGGLTKFGVEVVKEMNKLGMLIDISHICEKSFWDVIENSSDPIIASHSNCYTLCKHPRNLKDEQLKAIAKKGGVVCITFEPDFTGEKSISGVIKHIKYACSVIGTKHVGIGSDFDGLNNIPQGLEDVTKWLDIKEHLKRENFSEEDIKNILGNNVRRLLLNILK